MITNITSPTRGEKYTLEEVLRKGIERSSLRLAEWEFTKLHEDFYHSIDGVIGVTDFGASDPIWNDSVNFVVNGNIPVHFTEGHKMTIGFGCGVDQKYYGQFPGQADPENLNWEKYKETTQLGEILIYPSPGRECQIKHEIETEGVIYDIWYGEDQIIQKIPLIEAIHDENAMKILAEILQRKIAEGVVLGWSDTPEH